MGCHFLLQGIFPTQGSNPRLLNVLRWQTGSLPLVPPGEALIQVHHLQRKSTRKKGKEASGTRTPHGPSWGNRCFLRIFLLLLKTQFFRAEGLWLTIRFSSVQSLSRVQLCNLMDCSPPGSCVHGDSLVRNIGVGCHALLRGSSQPRD